METPGFIVPAKLFRLFTDFLFKIDYNFTFSTSEDMKIEKRWRREAAPNYFLHYFDYFFGIVLVASTIVLVATYCTCS